MTFAPAGFAALLRHRQSGGPAAGLQIQPEQTGKEMEQMLLWQGKYGKIAPNLSG